MNKVAFLNQSEPLPAALGVFAEVLATATGTGGYQCLANSVSGTRPGKTVISGHAPGDFQEKARSIPLSGHTGD
jgi:hypothetical protein